MACKPSEALPGASGPSIDGFRDHAVDERLIAEEQSESKMQSFARKAKAATEQTTSDVEAASMLVDEKSPINREKSVAHNIVGGAISFGLGLMIIVLMALVTGYFVAEVPANGEFAEAINTTTDIGGTGFIIFGVVLLAVPVVALIGYFMRSGLGGFINGGMGR